MKSFTDEHLAKLRRYLEVNASELASNNMIRRIPYYPGKENLREYLWTIVKIKDIGDVELYFTGSSSILKIKGVYVEEERVDSFNFRQIQDVLIKAYNEKLIDDIDKLLNNL